MITTLNRRIYDIIVQALESGRNIDISLFAEKLLPAELGLVVSLQNSYKTAENPKAVLTDCVEVILEERSILDSYDKSDISVEDWASDLKKLIDKKAKGN